MTFRKQMAQAMSELRSIMSSGESPTRNSRLTARTIQIAEPSNYDARKTNAKTRLTDGDVGGK
jgi:hypothetical protein